ncbi:hypothetical protein [Rhizobium sp. BK661]|uniref:hypothetical protein n=1 Tax=Rhizobium sp. BK661 TaxID=2586991 RepID=UPI002167D573|nr:hypothetical protein [Rhizobium sp. BK661]MCS3739320.1 hypothetical protein [Rhizobium sp. BK661]
MHINTKRFELEIHRDSIWVRVSLFGRTFQTFRDFSGQGLSATNWIKDAEYPTETESRSTLI